MTESHSDSAVASNEATPGRAVIYLRVSTKEQSERDGDPEGYSIPGQREACLRKAESLGAVVVDEYVDRGESARSANRPQLQRMLQRFESERDIDMLIVHKVDRLARNRADDVQITLALEASGVRLVSASEAIDNTPSGLLLHGIMASIAEFYSRNLATEVKKGALQKVKTGGTVGIAPTGYLNVRNPDGGKLKASIAVDPVRAPLIKWAFEAFATGDYTLRGMTDQLAELGLTCRPTGKYPEAPLALSKVNKILRNPYYVGVVRYMGVEYQGKHEPLISQEVFDAVQMVLDSRVRAGEKQRVHRHYLKGTLYCRRCESRLTISYAKGRRGGIYPYFHCLGRQRRNGCDLPYLSVDLVEKFVERIYAALQLSPDEADAIEKGLIRELRALKKATDPERKQLAAKIAQLDRERHTWAEKSMSGAVPDDISRENQQLLAKQLSNARRRLKGLEIPFDEVEETLRQSIELAKVCCSSYLDADPRMRRKWNHVFFEMVRMDEKEVGSAKFTPAVGTLYPQTRFELESDEPEVTFEYGRDQEDPRLVSVGGGSSESLMVGAEGLEPPTCWL